MEIKNDFLELSQDFCFEMNTKNVEDSEEVKLAKHRILEALFEKFKFARDEGMNNNNGLCTIYISEGSWGVSTPGYDEMAYLDSKRLLDTFLAEYSMYVFSYERSSVTDFTLRDYQVTWDYRKFLESFVDNKLSNMIFANPKEAAGYIDTLALYHGYDSETQKEILDMMLYNIFLYKDRSKEKIR